MTKKKRTYKKRGRKNITKNKKRQKLVISLAVFVVATSVIFSVAYIISFYLKSNNIQKEAVNAGLTVKTPSVIDVSFREGATYLGNHCAGVCHMSAKHKGDILVKYNGDIIVAGDIDAGGHHFTNKISKNVNIPAGKYIAKLESFDSYTDRKSASHANQAQEQYYVVFKKGNKTLARTNTTRDLRDGVEEASDITITNGPNNPVILNDETNKIIIQHAGTASARQAGQLSEFEPICMLLERIDEPKPKPKPQPKPQPRPKPKDEPKKIKPKKKTPPTCQSSIGNYIWYDTNGNGKQEDIEEGIQGIEVCASLGNDEYCDVTDKHGKYKIDHLCKGEYKVRVRGVGSLVQTYDPDGKKDNKTKVELNSNNDKHTKADFGYRGKAPSTGLATNIILLIGLSTLVTIGILLVMKKKGML